MKIVINRCYGGFSITYACAKKLGIDKYDASDYRTDERLIKMVEENADEVSALLLLSQPHSWVSGIKTPVSSSVHQEKCSFFPHVSYHLQNNICI